MAFYTLEHKVDSMRGWKRPLYTGRRVYPSLNAIKGRIRLLEREYGQENVVHMHQKGDLSTEVVYVRVA